MSVPSRDLIISMGPSTLSMVPRMRTGGGCCAHATDPSTDMTVSDAASMRGIDGENFNMVLPFLGFSCQSGIHFNCEVIPQPRGYSGTPALPSHRRRQPFAADTDTVGFERAVRQLFCEGDHVG